MQETNRILQLDASANPAGASSKRLGDYLLEQLKQVNPAGEMKVRDLNQDLSFIDSSWIAANFSAPDDRKPAQSAHLAFSDQLIEELKWADHIVLTTPMYNFGVPATLKAWIDLVCRAGVTFRYGPNGPQGLLEGKHADIIITTGGVPLASPVDFVSGYLKQVFSFIGIDDVNIVGADQMNLDAEASFAKAKSEIEQQYSAIAA
ncbi:MAG: NAD(P)H-dependent oxidoreductase [Gammaproteobacteria bacterium]|nr:NAD(P)H-dependent oxidoreductase [Gammaproteobacteria bacterium]